MKNSQGFSNVGYGPASAAAGKSQKVNLLVLIIVYLFTFIGFTFLVISQATTSWTIVDNYKDFVYPDEYQGLWQLCYDKQEYECIPREGLCEYLWWYVRKFPELALLIQSSDLGHSPCNVYSHHCLLLCCLRTADSSLNLF